MMRRPSKLHLCFEANGSGLTALRVLQQEPPWRVVRGFKTESGETLAHVHNVSGGILDTDTLECRIDVGPSAQAQITSTGATRIYRSRSADHLASQRTSVLVGKKAYLEYLPDQLIPFSGSRFVQSAQIELHDGASLIWWDLVAPGRDAGGELFRYESLACSFELSASGERIAIEQWAVEPLLRSPAATARLGPFRHFASCYVCRAGEPVEYWRKLERELQMLGDHLSGPEVLWGITSLKAHGLVARGVAVSGLPLWQGLIDIWKTAKWLLCGRAATLPRKVR